MSDSQPDTKQPEAVQALIEELRAAKFHSTANAVKGSKARIFNEDFDLTFTPEECELLLHSRRTVQQLSEALGEPHDTSVELTDLVLRDFVMDTLERTFSSVDEL